MHRLKGPLILLVAAALLLPARALAHDAPLDQTKPASPVTPPLAAGAPGTAPLFTLLSPAATAAHLESVTWGDPGFVAVGSEGALLFSADGLTWEATYAGTAKLLHQVIWTGNRYIAVGEGLGGHLLTSPDGRHWESQIKERLPLTTVAKGDPGIVAAGPCVRGLRAHAGDPWAATLLFSPDGRNWEPVTLPAKMGAVCGVAWGAGRFVAVTDTEATIWTSTDGRTWTYAFGWDVGAPAERAIVWGNDRFVVTDQHRTPFVSTDGLTWTESGAYPFRDRISFAKDRFWQADSSLASSTDGKNWHGIPSAMPAASVAWGAGRFVAVGHGGTILTSTDGETWAPIKVTHRQTLNATVTGPDGQRLLIGDEGEIWRQDADGAWVQVASYTPVSATPSLAHPRFTTGRYAGGRWILAGGPQGLIRTSSDGQTWQEARLAQGDNWADLTAMTEGLGRLWAAGPVGIWSTADGLTWQPEMPPTGLTIKAIAGDATRVIAVGQRSDDTGVILVKHAGTDWEIVQTTAIPLHSIAAKNGYYLAAGSGSDGLGLLLGSGDGQLWTPMDVPFVATKLTADPARGFAAIGRRNDQPMLFTSPDGQAWAGQAVTGEPSGLDWSGDELWLTGRNGLVLRAGPFCSGFTDLSAQDAACGPVSQLVAAGLVKGYPDGRFGAEAYLSRAEVATLLVRLRKAAPAPDGALAFPDTQGHWSAREGYLQAGVKLGLLTGYPDGTFRPDAPVTRAELIKLAVATRQRMTVPAGPSGYADVLPEHWFHNAVVAARQEGLIGPGARYPLWVDQALQPDRPVTRAEAALLLANLQP
jgi:hypothetical protein